MKERYIRYIPREVHPEEVLVDRILCVKHGISDLLHPCSCELVGHCTTAKVRIPEEGLNEDELVTEALNVLAYSRQLPTLAHHQLLDPPQQRPNDGLRHLSSLVSLRPVLPPAALPTYMKLASGICFVSLSREELIPSWPMPHCMQGICF
jgi:hypothetical protein